MKFKKALSLLAAAETSAANDYDLMVPVYADFLESTINGSDLMEPAAEYLIEQGRITSEQYEMWQQLRNNLPAG